MKKSIFIALTVVLIYPAILYCRQLTVFFFERPPYYETIGDRAEGFLVDRTRQIFAESGIDPEFKSIPPQRILANIKKSNLPVCAIGWFKTEQRQSFAKFSIPIYQNRPLVILTTKKYQDRIERHHRIKDVFMDRSLILAKIDSFSYGTVMDHWMAEYLPRTHTISSHQKILPRMILLDRASYMLIAPEEIDTMLVSEGLDPRMFVSISKPDIPKGNLRYIIFSKSVSDETVERINAAIRQTVHLKKTD